jgi:hypothetical protein
VTQTVGTGVRSFPAREAGHDFVARGSVVRRIWGDPEMILLVFAGSAAEFALPRA